MTPTLDSMPPEGWVRFTQMLNHFEAIQSWPSAVKHWKVTFLPKSSSPDVDKFRPLSIGSIVYRIWARCRVQDYGRLVDPHLGKFQAGHNCDVRFFTYPWRVNTLARNMALV